MGFSYAISGIIDAIKTERNLRFHLVIANLIVVFAAFYGISKVEWALLALMISLVISAELFNTALENAVDTATDKISKTAKLAKDASAGAVLVLAAMSVVLGFIIFGDLEKIEKTLTLIFASAKILVPCLVLGIFDVWFLIFGGKNGK